MKPVQDLIGSIVRPDPEYRPVMMWFWNGHITEKGIEEELALFKSQNITDFFIHPAEGMDVEYLSDRFMELVAHAVAYAKENGMHFWIYDEYNWPSGVAGEKVLIDHPEYHARCVANQSITVEDGALAEVPCETFLAAQYELDGVRTDVTDECRFIGGRCYWKNVTGHKVIFSVQSSVHHDMVWPYAVGCKGSKRTSGSVDLTSAEATRCFISYTHERYKEYIGAEFGTTVRGVFTDEPSHIVFRYMVSDSLLRALDDKYGPYPERYLYLLFQEGEEATAFRHDYYKALSMLFKKNFIDIIADWCENNNLLLTGHLNGEESLPYNIINGETLNVLKSFGVPGIDIIVITHRMHWPDFNTLMATAQNLNHFSGKKRLLSETYTLSTWSLSMAYMRRLASRLIMHGVNMIQFMGCHYSFSGAKTIHPGPDNGVHNVLFPYYHIFGDDVARLSALSAETVPSVKIMVLQPLAAFGEKPMNEPDGNFSVFPKNHDAQVSAVFHDVINALCRLNIGYELIYESQLEDDGVYVDNGKLCIPNPALSSDIAAENAYEMVILPMTSCTHSYTRKILEKFVASGGSLVLINDAPAYSIDDFAAYNFSGLDDFRASAKSLQNGEWKEKATVCGRTKEGIFTILSNDIYPLGNEFCQALSECIRESGVKDAIDIKASPEIYSTRRIGRAKNGSKVWYFYLENHSPEAGTAHVHVNTGLPCLILNTERPCIEAEFSTESSIVIPGCACRIIVSADEETLEAFQALPVAPSFSSEKEVPMEDFHFTALNPNTMRLDFAEYSESETLADAHGEEICKTLESASVDAFHVPSNEPKRFFAARAFFDVEQGIRNLKLIAENICNIRLWLNGKELTDGEEKTIITEPYIVYDVETLVKTGQNTVIMTCCTEAPCGSYTMPLVIMSGDFLLDGENMLVPIDGTVPCKGLWTDMGYRQYGGTCAYELDLTGEKREPAAIRFETPDSIRVFADGVLIGEAIGAPYEFELPAGTRIVRAEVTGLLHNLYWGTNKPRIDEKNNGGTIPSGISGAQLLYR